LTCWPDVLEGETGGNKGGKTDDDGLTIGF